MKSYYLVIISLLFLVTGSQSFNQDIPSGNISITLKKGLWKPTEKDPIYQDITLDLICKDNICQKEIWGHAPDFNHSDHYGTVEIIRLYKAWRLQVNLNIRPDPWRSLTGTANYEINLIPNQKQKNNLIGNYSGNFNDQNITGKIDSKITGNWPKTITNHQPIQPREHPRLIFRKSQLPLLRKKAKTESGTAIIERLQIALDSEIYYDGYVPNGGYHAAGHCFIGLLNNDQKAAETAWEIVEKSINNPGKRLLEHAPIVAGVALAYDLCYDSWDEKRLKKITNWLYQESKILALGQKGKGWNPNSWSNWSARARGAAGLATLAIMNEPERFFIESNVEKEYWRSLKISERNIKRLLTIGIGDRGFGTEGDHYTTEPLILTIIPFLQAYKNVLGQDLISNSSAEWFLPHYVMRMVGTKGKLSLPAYGRHRYMAAGSLFAMGWETVPEKHLPAVQWFFERNFGLQGDQTFGIGTYKPYQAAFALMGYRENIIPKNPAQILGHVLADKQKGLYVFRNRWQNNNDFVASIYLQKEPLKASWSFPDTGSFRIRGLGEKWAKAGPSQPKKINENVILSPDLPPKDKKNLFGAKPIFFKSFADGSGVVSLSYHNWLRSFAVDYSGKSGVPGLFVIVDKFQNPENKIQEKTWIMHTDGKVSIAKQSFTITSNSGATMQGTFITPSQVNISFQPRDKGGIIKATGSDNFFIIMTVQKGLIPKIKVAGSGLNSHVQVGEQSISFQDEKIVFSEMNKDEER
jgi:hypothetical protein